MEHDYHRQQRIEAEDRRKKELEDASMRIAQTFAESKTAGKLTMSVERDKINVVIEYLREDVK